MRTRALTRPAVAAIAAIATFGACGGGGDAPTEPTGPVAGVLGVRLAAPAGRDAAALLTIDGPAAPAEITAAQPGVTVHVRQAGTTATVALFGPVAAGELLRFGVPDVAAASSYRVTIREVAGEDNALRPDLTAYRATVAAPAR